MLNGVPRILIIRLSAIGDVIRVLPALHALRDQHPYAQIDWAIEPKAAAIVEDHPAIDRVLVFDRPPHMRDSMKSFREFCKEIRESRYDVAFDFHGILKSGWILRATRAPERYGFAAPRAQEGSHLFANKRVRLPKQRLNRIEENLALCELAGARATTLDVEVEIPEEVGEDTDAFMQEAFDGGKRLIAVHAAVDRPEKQWPLDRYAKLCDMLLADGRFDVMLTWGPGQRDVAVQVSQIGFRKPVIAPETPTLKHLASLLQCCSLYVGGDTGPMHLASAMGAATVALFGGTDPALHAPFRDPCRVLYKGPNPAPPRVDTKHGARYLASIEVDEAFEACMGILLPSRAERMAG